MLALSAEQLILLWMVHIATIALSMLLQALRPTSIASENTKRKESKFIYAIVLLATAASIVRAEVALLLVGVVALVFYKESTAPSNAGTSVAGDKNTLPATRKYRLTLLAVRTTIVAGILGAAMSLAVDSYFWSAWLADYRQQEQQLAVNNNSSGQNAGMLQHLLKVVGFGTYWIWPEAWGLLFNVVEGKSSMWGAMDLLHQVHQERFVGLEGEKSVANEAVRIFLPPGPRMTGASAYTFRYAPPSGHWEYNTTESLSTDFGAPEQLWKDGFDYVVTSMDEAESFIAPSDEGKARWALLRSVDAFGGVQRRKGLVPLKVRWKREIGILGRN
ncbi:hypothetical protein QFC22_003760 [Naganishia vaughanmartiniae]|uniref:Uncharacterized protein n=1 Tax=Naganishia vaughanmartiniae TaxID=1424756 RepID=A0ACC2X668_9TREE|nr:hypothetical protein QFC22_003760 [Naganishia vaughanmartiniae]